MVTGFTTVHICAARRDAVWRAWTEPDRLARWWGPENFDMGVIHMDFRPGGHFHYSMRSPEGLDMWGKITYQEIKPLESMVFVNSFSDADGGVTRHPLNDNWPLEVMNTLTLEDAPKGKTKVSIRSSPIFATEKEILTFEDGKESLRQGYAGTWQKLDHYLAQQ